ncbi:MAG TPA: hypothetical protein VFU97_07220 [Xanthobacteraceae bacterium]|nr:hypothetical protein [Xanthobacteraceae bacterium]
MHRIKSALIATAAIGFVALATTAANAQYAGPYAAYGPDGYYGETYRSPLGGRYYSYGADRSNPSFGPNSFDQDNPRDFQLQGK